MKGYVRIVTDDNFNGRVGYILETIDKDNGFQVTFDMITPFEEQKKHKDFIHRMKYVFPFAKNELWSIDEYT